MNANSPSDTEQTELEYILENKKYPSGGVNAVLKSIGLFLFSLLALSVSIGFTYFYKAGELKGVNKSLFIFIGIVFIYGIMTLLGIKNEWTSDRCFTEIVTNKPVKENVALIKSILENKFKLNGISTSKNENIVVAETKTSILAWGDVITIICDDNRVLINSKASGQQFFSYGQQRRNVKKLRGALLSK